MSFGPDPKPPPNPPPNTEPPKGRFCVALLLAKDEDPARFGAEDAVWPNDPNPPLTPELALRASEASAGPDALEAVELEVPRAPKGDFDDAPSAANPDEANACDEAGFSAEK